MKYVPPYGRETEGDAAHYINGNPVEGRQGSIPPAAAFENPMREIMGVIQKSRFIPDDADLLQMARGVRSQALNWGIDTGSASQLSVSYDPPLGEYTNGLVLHVLVSQDCIGPSTIDAGPRRVSIRTMAGAEMSAGDLQGGGVAALIYDGTNFQLMNFFGQGGGTSTGPTTTYYTNIPYAVDQGSVNIIDATFTSLDTDPLNPYSLKAGDPFLVRIKNTNTGSSIARFKTSKGALGDKPIRANGGGSTAALLQGDLQQDDVVLFIYDGTQFWIQPNPIITADTTINVPTQYTTPENALLAIRRKGIAQNARVTILLAANAGPVNDPTRTIVGGYNPFTINHNNAERITIRGVMKIAGNLTGNDFAKTGNSAAARAQDSQTNYAMLQTRFGVQIVVPPAGSVTTGIQNVGPGQPTVQDMMISGPNYWSGDGVGRWMGVGALDQRQLQCVNVSCHGLDVGFFGGGTMRLTYCNTSGCFRNGFLATTLATFSLNTCAALGGSLNGMTANQNSGIYTYGCWANFNSNVGASCSDAGQLTYHTSQAVGNANVDVAAGTLSYVVILNAGAAGGVGTISPSPGVLSSDGALVVVG